MELIAGKYEIIRELGTGGYGKVYLVRHADIGIHYALKLLSRRLSEDTELLERFRREAELLLRVAHPRIAQLRDFGRTSDGLYYMTIDFCEGISLQKVIENEQWLPVADVLTVAIQILEALEGAHAAGVIHRDIKPANLMYRVDAQGKPQICILDFGIAKLKEAPTTTMPVTREGLTIGTPQYMSPEQASGDADLDARVDLYATSVVMYELITGAVPFRGETVLQTLIKHLTQPPKPFAQDLCIPQFIESLIFKGLEKEREHRYKDAKEFRLACEDALKKLFLAGSEEIERSNGEFDPSTPHYHDEENSPNQTTILCLDDNDMILNITRHIFEKEGFKVITASNFSSIHDYIFSQGVKLMLCDVEMPGLPGTTICKMLKQSVSDLKIVLFSNVPERELEKLSRESSADSFLSKNTKPEEWIAKVKAMLGQ